MLLYYSKNHYKIIQEMNLAIQHPKAIFNIILQIVHGTEGHMAVN